jgi:hypothetical protein
MKMELCRPCKNVIRTMVEEENRGLLEANKKPTGNEKLILQCFYAGRLALLIDIAGGTGTRKTPQQVLKLIENCDKETASWKKKGQKR